MNLGHSRRHPARVLGAVVTYSIGSQAGEKARKKFPFLSLFSLRLLLLLSCEHSSFFSGASRWRVFPLRRIFPSPRQPTGKIPPSEIKIQGRIKMAQKHENAGGGGKFCFISRQMQTSPARVCTNSGNVKRYGTREAGRANTAAALAELLTASPCLHDAEFRQLKHGRGAKLVSCEGKTGAGCRRVRRVAPQRKMH